MTSGKCDGIIKYRKDLSFIDARHSCHVCLVALHKREPNVEVMYRTYDDDFDEPHVIYNTLEVYLVDTGRI